MKETHSEMVSLWDSVFPSVSRCEEFYFMVIFGVGKPRT
jgi:hypothetical protein